VLFALLAYGVMARNLDRRHDLMAVDTSRIGQLFFVVLFVVGGASLQLSEMAAGGALALVYILARFAGKSIGVLSLMHFSGVRAGSAGLLCITLMPMSSMALVMVQGTTDLYPEFGVKLSAIILSAVLILELLGPLAVQFALKRAGEAGEEEQR
jgi:Kef-type K+ transport system membrane component KefB